MTSRLPAAAERHVDVGQVRLRVLEQGSGPAVVLCHGFPGLARTNEIMLNFLRAVHHG